MESIDDVLPPEKIAFIAYNIGVYESVQKFGGLITSGKITDGTDVSKVAELLSQSTAFYDAVMIAGLINAIFSGGRTSSMDSIIIFNSHSKDNNLVIVIPAESVYLTLSGL